MKGYIERMMKEEAELVGKINKLSAFIDNGCNGEKLELFEHGLLVAQLHSMITYDTILLQRITLAMNKEEKEGDK